MKVSEEISFDSELMSAGLGPSLTGDSPLRVGAGSFVTGADHDIDLVTGESVPC